MMLRPHMKPIWGNIKSLWKRYVCPEKKRSHIKQRITTMMARKFEIMSPSKRIRARPIGFIFRNFGQVKRLKKKKKEEHKKWTEIRYSNYCNKPINLSPPTIFINNYSHPTYLQFLTIAILILYQHQNKANGIEKQTRIKLVSLQ